MEPCMVVVVVAAAVLLDRLAGELPGRWHPLVGFGVVASAMERSLRRLAGREAALLRLAGAAAVTALVIPASLVAYGLSNVPSVGAACDVLILYLTIGLRSLEEHAIAVAKALTEGNLSNAREAVGRIVSRDTGNMSTNDVARAAVESVLENGNDAVFGAVFWFIVLGAPGALMYRLVNTLDAMWGYRSERYLHYGWAAARLDDLLNFIPARLSALTYSLAGRTVASLRCWKSQGGLWYSPNAGPVMAAGAGALEVRLGGSASYAGQKKERPELGCGAEPRVDDIERAVALVQRGLVGWIVVLAVFCSANATAGIEAIDDLGHTVRLEKPAGRIISFAPHVTELLFAIGAGDKIVGVVKHSDYPEQAKRIPEIGTNRAADLERIVSLQPDLIIAWFHASSLKQLDRLRSTGIPVYYSNPQTLKGIASEGERLATLAGTEAEAARWADQFRQRHARLFSTFAARPKVKVFYQVSGRPLYTLNREHFVSDLLTTCGATNIFGTLPIVAPVVNIEAVLHADPQAIIAAIPAAELKSQWESWTDMQAVRLKNLFTVNADLTHRPGPRAMDAAETLCEKIDEARMRLSKRGQP